MRRLRVTFPTSLNEKDEALRAEVYWREFAGVSYKAFESAVLKALGSCSFFPKPKELHDFIQAESERKWLEDRSRLLQWMEPNEEGKKVALEMMSQLQQS
jgi:hypothetical protein